MTKEEAIEELKNVDTLDMPARLCEAHYMAIKALEQEPCEDAISRQAVIDGINRYFHDEYYQRTSIQDCRDCLIEDVIKQLPSVNPQKTQMIDKSNFDQEQYKADLQCAYDCGKASVNPQEPKIGHWEWVQYDYNPKIGNWHCSECRSIVIESVYKNEKAGIPLYKFCPNCGAKMQKSEEQEN